MSAREDLIPVNYDDLQSGSAEKRNQDLLNSLLEESPELWAPKYGYYNRVDMESKVARLAYYLREQSIAIGKNPAEIDEEAEVSYQFLERVFDEYDSESQLPHRKLGSFAFMVPTRIRREVDGHSDGYMNEWAFFHPMLQRVDSNIAQRFLVGTPPFIVDQYGVDAKGRRGYMLFAPFFADMGSDIGADAFTTIPKIMRDSIEFARKIGVETVGLGATLPGVLFTFDKAREDIAEKVKKGLASQKELDAIDFGDKEMRITTGHAGTVWLITKTLEALKNNGHQGLDGKIGIIGTGNIGTATLDYLRKGLGYEKDILVSDKAPHRALKLQETIEGVIAAENNTALLQEADTIICAATTPVRLRKLGGLGLEALRGKAIIDDSQPGAFDPDEVKAYGGQIVWPIGQDTTPLGEMTLEWLTYSGYGPVRRSEVWGCQLESWLVQRHQKVSELAVRSQVQPQDVLRIDPYLRKHGIKAAPLQAQGIYL